MIKKLKLPGKSISKDSFVDVLSDLYQVSELFKELERGDILVSDFIDKCSSLFCEMCGCICIINDHFDFKDPNYVNDFSEDLSNLYRVFLHFSK